MLNNEAKRLIKEVREKLNKKVTEIRKKNLVRPNPDEITTLENNLKAEINEIERVYSEGSLNSDNISYFRKEIETATKAVDTVFQF